MLKNVFFLWEKMLQYLEGGASNRLLLAVKHDLNTAEYVAKL